MPRIRLSSYHHSTFGNMDLFPLLRDRIIPAIRTPFFRRPSYDHVSIAQRCPEDILRIIYSRLSYQDYACGALVCRQWSEVCMEALYHHVVYDPMRNKCVGIPQALRASRAARMRVRFVDVYLTADLGLYSWVSLLLKDDRPRQLDVRIIAYSYPTLPVATAHAVTHLTLYLITHRSGWYNDLFAAFPSLVSFAAKCGTDLSSRADIKITVPMKLQRLSISSPQCTPLVTALLDSVRHSLQQLHLYIECGGLDGRIVSDSICKLQGLDELILSGYFRDCSPLERIIPRLPKLRHVCGGTVDPTRTISLISDLPRTIESLCIQWQSLYPVNDVLNLVERSKDGANRLTRLWFGGCEKEEANETIERACRDARVFFRDKLSLYSLEPLIYHTDFRLSAYLEDYDLDPHM